MFKALLKLFGKAKEIEEPNVKIEISDGDSDEIDYYEEEEKIDYDFYQKLNVEKAIPLIEDFSTCLSCGEAFKAIPKQSKKCTKCKTKNLIKRMPFNSEKKTIILEEEYNKKYFFWVMEGEVNQSNEVKNLIECIESCLEHKHPISNDILWDHYNKLSTKYASTLSMSSYCYIRQRMVNLLEHENELEKAFPLVCEILFMNINGTMGARKGFDKEMSFVPPGPMQELFIFAKELNYSESVTKDKYLEFVKRFYSDKVHFIAPEKSFDMIVSEHKKFKDSLTKGN